MNQDPADAGRRTDEVSTQELAALTGRLRELSHAITTGTADDRDLAAFQADRDTLLARLRRDQHDDHEDRSIRHHDRPDADVSSSDPSDQLHTATAVRGPLPSPVPDHQLVRGSITLPGGLPPDEDEPVARLQQLNRWHTDDPVEHDQDDDAAGWS